mgnify:FL=1
MSVLTRHDPSAPRAVRPAPGESVPAGATDTALLERPHEDTARDRPWNVVVWNDPVNLMSYVAYVFRTHFGYSAAKAQRLMLEVHERGRSVVATGTKAVSYTHLRAHETLR